MTTPPAFGNAAGTNAADYIPGSPVNGSTTTGVATDYNTDTQETVPLPWVLLRLNFL